jgi:hypothetical protein
LTSACLGSTWETRDREKTSERDYFIWEARGRPNGCVFDHWPQAEAQMSPKPRPRKKAMRIRAETSEAKAQTARKKNAASSRSKAKKRS